MYKNTTYQNIIMYYLEFVFLNCPAVMAPTLTLTFLCLSGSFLEMLPGVIFSGGTTEGYAKTP